MRVKCIGDVQYFTKGQEYCLESGQDQLLAKDDLGQLTVIVGPEIEWSWFQRSFVFVQQKPLGYVDVELLDDKVREDVMEHLGIEDVEDFPKDMMPMMALDHYLIWNGIVGYTGDIVETIENIRAAASEDCCDPIFDS